MSRRRMINCRFRIHPAAIALAYPQEEPTPRRLGIAVITVDFGLLVVGQFGISMGVALLVAGIANGKLVVIGMTT